MTETRHWVPSESQGGKDGVAYASQRVASTARPSTRVELVNRPGDADLRAAALFHVARQNCTGSYGFFDNPDGLKLDGNDCGALSGEPVIDAIENLDPQRDSRAIFDAVQARCAANLPVRYAARDGRTLEAPCRKPLVEPEVWAIVSAPALRLNSAAP